MNFKVAKTLALTQQREIQEGYLQHLIQTSTANSFSSIR